MQLLVSALYNGLSQIINKVWAKIFDVFIYLAISLVSSLIWALVVII